jgi:hypothetical protein
MCDKFRHNMWETSEIAKFLDNGITTFRNCDSLHARKTHYCLQSELKEIKKFDKWIKSGKEKMPKFKILQFDGV